MLVLTSTRTYGSELFERRLKTFREFPGSLEAVTGSSSRQVEIFEYFKGNQNRLPQTGQKSEFTLSFILAELSYSSFFCQAMILRDQKLPPEERWAHRKIDWKVNPMNWSESLRKSILDEYAQLFWQRSLTVDESFALETTWSSLILQVSNRKESSADALIGLCVTFLTAPQFVVQ